MAFATRGQPGATAAVARAVRAEHVPHALLLVGPPSSGKSTLATDLAAGLMCLAEDPGQRPCRACAACRKVDHGNHPDVHRVLPEGAGGQVRLAQVQALATELVLLPMEGRYRIAIIEGAHRLNPDAQNALLKTLEEPPPRVCIVLCADDESDILPTVRSRCARIRLGPVAGRDIAALLADRGLADASRAAALARASGGRPGLALALALEPDAELVEARLVRRLVDLAGADRRTRLGAATDLTGDGALLAAAAERGMARAASGDGRVAQPDDEMPAESRASAPPAPARLPPAERRRAVARVIETWRSLARDLAVAAAGAPAAVTRSDLLDELVPLAAAMPPDDLVAFLARLDALSAALESYANPELLLDTLLLEWPRARPAFAVPPA